MSLLLDSYRRNAAAALIEAEGAILPSVRTRAIDAAARWTELAERLERVEAESESKPLPSPKREKVDDERGSTGR